ncbi:uncharacterized protein [Argopecten irradians]|uniref:uncharacterized protein n=1 Tax=Argopecten irradians TaxID=31199 RepID=UPI00372220D9
MERLWCFMVLVLYCWLPTGHGHGRLIEPPMRSSAWRYGFPTPKNYNDNELNCGGFPNMMRQGGRCGPCGDPWQGPRDNEAGGKYSTGVITRQYASGQTINITVQLTSNHKGYFEFRLCPNNNGQMRVTQACFDQYLLRIVGLGTKYHIDAPDSNVFIDLLLELPPGVSCSNCVLQWKWRAAQNRGPDGKGGECFGCGPQEHFINCADVSISPYSSSPLPLTRSPGGGAVVRFKAIKPEASSAVSYEIKSSSKNSAALYSAPSRPAEPVQAPAPVPTQNMFTQISHEIFPAGFGMYGNSMQNSMQNMFRNMFDGDMGYMNMAMKSIRSQPAPPTTPKPRPQIRYSQPQSNSVKLPTDPRALTATILSYANSIPDGNDNANFETCQDGYTKPTCSALPSWDKLPQIGKWCQSMCPSGLCPAAVCGCTCPVNILHQMSRNFRGMTSQCRGIPGWTDAAMDAWCASNCNSEFCASEMCTCE